ncbi:HipA domain-containing protein [Telmatocola sphagniphila]|uniref:HipA domain-containing protein n=1 Tax=Telmatocola sphagniphila TaxID=1123043 RepID=A0A8E6B9R8_9BACT|nr:HipA domain-containing protein [Telmatocola sphagniphila]QVL34351.1 HipA domain-containing protein [Telmatocola sphagniphila]
MNGCPSCFKSGHNTFCTSCRKRLFNGKKVSHILPFSRPAYNEAKLKVTPERMSISGIQTKMSLVLEGTQLKMVESGGQYILKPIPLGQFQRLEVTPLNEHLTMQLARQIFDIDVADNTLVQFEDGQPAYLVRRFDVQADGRRSLKEDFAQIGNLSEENRGQNYKYDFSYEEIGELIRQYVAVHALDLERFFTLVVFNYLVNNGDAHAKNFSLMRDENTGEYRLSPAYDLLNTRLHVPLESRTALDLFKENYETDSFKANGFYAHDDFVEFARRLNLVEGRYQRILKKSTDRIGEVFEFIDKSQLPADCKTLYREHVTAAANAIGYSLARSQKG